MLILSGPVELLILLYLMASLTCDVVSCMKIANVYVYYSVFTAYCVFYCVGELLVEYVCYLFWCDSCFVVEYYGVVWCLGRHFIA